MAIHYRNPQTGEYEVIKIPVMRGEQGHSGIHVGSDEPPTTDVKLWFDPSDTENDVDLANRLDTTLTACYDYMGNDRGSIKAAADANVDWLLGEINTVHYDGQHITATDSIEGRSKSAILKGNTVVNLIPKLESGNYYVNGSNSVNLESNEYILYHSTTANNCIKINRNVIADKLRQDTEYTLIVNIVESTITNKEIKMGISTHDNLSCVDGTNYVSSNRIDLGCTVGFFKEKIRLKETLHPTRTSDMYFCFWDGTGNDTEYVKFKVMLLEGDYTNVDIPYFTGMQSVKMPVLTTTGKNLANPYSFSDEPYFNCNGDYYTTHGGNTSVDGDIITVNTKSVNSVTCKTGLIPVRPGSTYRVSEIHLTDNFVRELNIRGMTYYDNNLNMVGGQWDGGYNKPLIMPNNTYYVEFGFTFWGTPNESTFSFKFQFEEGEIVTSYEPYKSNILTVNEDVTLRKIGDVEDELNCLTGEVTQRIGEIMLDGSMIDNTLLRRNGSSFLMIRYSSIGFKKIDDTKNIISSKLRNVKFYSSESFNIGDVSSDAVGWGFAICYANNETATKDEAISYLNNLNPIVQGYLSEESIKTVDLSDNHVYSYKDVTHYDCSSTEGSLVPTLSIDVPTNLSALVTRQRNQIETLKEENKGLNQELQLAITSSEENDNELLAQSFELDFRLMEVEFALDLPMAATFSLGGKAMAMTPYEMAKKLILAGNYERADMEHKLDVYVSKKRMTEEERQELIQLMNEKEGIITTDPIESEVEETDAEHEAVTIPLH